MAISKVKRDGRTRAMYLLDDINPHRYTSFCKINDQNHFW